MSEILPIPVDRTCIVRVSHDDRSFRLAISMGRVFKGGPLVQWHPSANVELTGIDDLAKSYTEQNWRSGISSGAFYAFRNLDLARQHVIVSELTGDALSNDMELLATATAMGIATLAGRSLEPTISCDSPGQRIEIEVVEEKERTLTSCIATVAGPGEVERASATTSTRV